MKREELLLNDKKKEKDVEREIVAYFTVLSYNFP
jgi:hypothetical protein